jgi:hypothetical protein
MTDTITMKTVIVLVILLSQMVSAEYRVFSLKIESPDGHDVRQVNSNLDPEQYVRYYPIKPNYKISYSNTWMCKGRTNQLPYCPDPKLPRQPASVDSPADQSPANP